jgi:hypothetical protein
MAGPMASIDEVIARLDDLVADAIAAGDRMGYFASLYRQVTVAVRDGIEAGEFEDGARMDAFDTAFGNRYFAALDAWRAGAQPPKCWEQAFKATQEGNHLIIQHLLLGINAHINLDLGVAAATVAPGPTINALKTDFDRINTVLISVLQTLQSALDRCSPLMNILDQVGGRSDEEIMGFSIKTSRADAWAHALLLARGSDHIDELTLGILDQKVAILARLVRKPGFMLGHAIELIRHSESDDISSVIETLNSATVVRPSLAG